MDTLFSGTETGKQLWTNQISAANSGMMRSDVSSIRGYPVAETPQRLGMSRTRFTNERGSFQPLRIRPDFDAGDHDVDKALGGVFPFWSVVVR